MKESDNLTFNFKKFNLEKNKNLLVFQQDVLSLPPILHYG